MVRVVGVVLALLLFTSLLTKSPTEAREMTKNQVAVGILHPGHLVCSPDGTCFRSWWLLNEHLEFKVILKGKSVPPELEGYLIWVKGNRSGIFFEVENFQVLNNLRFGDLLPKVAENFKSNFPCLITGDHFLGNLKEVWSGEHNEVTLIFRFYSTTETPPAYVELRYNGRNGRFLGRSTGKYPNPCQIQFRL